MTFSATVSANIDATAISQGGLATSIKSHPLSFVLEVVDCTNAWADRRTIGAGGADDVDLMAAGFGSVKVVCVRNLSGTSQIGLSAGWNGSDFRNFLIDSEAWNFSPMVNLGGLTLRGLPIRPSGVFLLSCPNSTGFSTTTGGSVIRIGGPEGTQYEIYVMGT